MVFLWLLSNGFQDFVWNFSFKPWALLGLGKLRFFEGIFVICGVVSIRLGWRKNSLKLLFSHHFLLILRNSFINILSKLGNWLFFVVVAVIDFFLQSTTLKRHFLRQGFYLHDWLGKLRRILACDSLLEDLGRIAITLRWERPCSDSPKRRLVRIDKLGWKCIVLKRNQIWWVYHWQLVQNIWSIDVWRRLREVSDG